MLWVCGIAFVATMIALALALMRARRGDERTPPDLTSLEQTERGPLHSVSTGTAITVALLIVLLVASVLTDRALARLPLGDPVTIQFIGHQWWWEVKYDDPQPSRVFSTANEIHIPVGRPVVMTLTADDVIHSFWVPNLHGKRDLIPGHTAITQFRADTPGVYRGQCAEFCGYQHAKMAMLVIAEPADQYEQWAQQQRQSAPRPTDPVAQRGEQVFMSTTCIMCHAIQGTDANGAESAGPHPPREPAHARRGHVREQAGPARRMDRRSAGAEAGREHAAQSAAGRRSQRARRLSRHAPLAAHGHSGRHPRKAPTASRATCIGNAAEQLEQAWGDKPGLMGWLCTVDHKVVGRRFIATAFGFFVAGGILAALMRLQLAQAREHVDRTGPLQPAVHDARHDDDVPVRRADHGSRRASTWCR